MRARLRNCRLSRLRARNLLRAGEVRPRAHESMRRSRFGQLRRSTTKDGKAASGWLAGPEQWALERTRDRCRHSGCEHGHRCHGHVASRRRNAFQGGEHLVPAGAASGCPDSGESRFGARGRQCHAGAAFRFQPLDPIRGDAHGAARQRRHDEEQLHERKQSTKPLHGAHGLRRVGEPGASVKLRALAMGLRAQRPGGLTHGDATQCELHSLHRRPAPPWQRRGGEMAETPLRVRT